MHDPKHSAAKSKPQLQLIPPVASMQCAKALEHGAEKYGAFNWRKSDGIEIMTYLGAILRHTNAVLDGEDIDPESGALHLGHIMAGCCVLIDAMNEGKIIDNRPPKT